MPRRLKRLPDPRDEKLAAMRQSTELFGYACPSCGKGKEWVIPYPKDGDGLIPCVCAGCKEIWFEVFETRDPSQIDYHRR